jgi:uncharacterized protein YijF (DUF1287 family)
MWIEHKKYDGATVGCPVIVTVLTVVGLDLQHNIAEDITDNWAKQRQDNDNDDSDQDKDESVLDEALAFFTRYE